MLPTALTLFLSWTCPAPWYGPCWHGQRCMNLLIIWHMTVQMSCCWQGWCLAAVKEKILLLINMMQAEEPPADTRCAFVGYRDYNCGEDRIVSRNFMGDPAAFLQFLLSVCTMSHANPDYAEDIAGGLEVHPLFVFLADMHRQDALPD